MKTPKYLSRYNLISKTGKTLKIGSIVSMRHNRAIANGPIPRAKIANINGWNRQFGLKAIDDSWGSEDFSSNDINAQWKKVRTRTPVLKWYPFAPPPGWRWLKVGEIVKKTDRFKSAFYDSCYGVSTIEKKDIGMVLPSCLCASFNAYNSGKYGFIRQRAK